MVFPAPLPGTTAGDRNRTDPGSGGAEVRARVARAAHPMGADRLGLAVQPDLAVRARRRAPRRGEAVRRGHRAMAAQRPTGQRAATAGPDRRAALEHDSEKWVPMFRKGVTIKQQARAADDSKEKSSRSSSRIETARPALRDGAHGLSQGADRRAGTQDAAQGHRSRLSR